MTATRVGGAGTSGSAPTVDISAVEWLSLLEEAESDLQSAELELTEKALTQREKRTIAKKISDSAGTLNKLEKALTKYEANPIRYKIGDGEISRRRELLTQAKQLQQRVDAAGGGATAERGRGGRRGRAQLEETEETAAMDNQQLHSQQKQIIQVQDEKLDNILHGVTTLKVMSQDINQELDLHHHLLNDLDGAVDQTDQKIQLNTKKIDIIEKKSRGWMSVICMLLWLVLIVLLLATNIFCPLFALMGSNCDGHKNSAPPAHSCSTGTLHYISSSSSTAGNTTTWLENSPIT